jgi:hypothetical protein
LPKKLIIANNAFEMYVYSIGKTRFTPCAASISFNKSQIDLADEGSICNNALTCINGVMSLNISQGIICHDRSFSRFVCPPSKFVDSILNYREINEIAKFYL